MIGNDKHIGGLAQSTTLQFRQHHPEVVIATFDRLERLRCARTDSVLRIIFWMLLIQSAVGLVPALYEWRNPSLALWPWIVIIAFSGMSSHFCLARALAHADATIISPMDFLRVPLSALVGWLLYHEQIDIFTAGGAALILAGNLLNLQRKTPRLAEAETTTP